MSSPAATAVVRDWLLQRHLEGRLSLSVVAVGLALSRRWNVRQRAAWPSQEQLARDTGLSVRQVKRATAILTDSDGCLDAERRSRKPTRYTLKIDVAQGDTHTSPHTQPLRGHPGVTTGRASKVTSRTAQGDKSGSEHLIRELGTGTRTRSRSAARRGRSLIDVAICLWTERLGFEPTWKGQKGAYAILQGIRKDTGEADFIPAVRVHLARDNAFLREKGWHPKLMRADLDGILATLRGSGKKPSTSTARRFIPREL